jgi:hypothetical protein
MRGERVTANLLYGTKAEARSASLSQLAEIRRRSERLSSFVHLGEKELSSIIEELPEITAAISESPEHHFNQAALDNILETLAKEISPDCQPAFDRPETNPTPSENYLKALTQVYSLLTPAQKRTKKAKTAIARTIETLQNKQEHLLHEEIKRFLDEASIPLGHGVLAASNDIDLPHLVDDNKSGTLSPICTREIDQQSDLHPKQPEKEDICFECLDALKTREGAEKIKWQRLDIEDLSRDLGESLTQETESAIKEGRAFSEVEEVRQEALTKVAFERVLFHCKKVRYSNNSTYRFALAEFTRWSNDGRPKAKTVFEERIKRIPDYEPLPF